MKQVFIFLLITYCFLTPLAADDKASKDVHLNTSLQESKDFLVPNVIIDKGEVRVGFNAPFTLYELKGSEPGATLLVIGGIHGDEPGGYFAPSVLLSHYHIKKGNLYVIPNLNPDSIVRFRRGVYGDMNRKFAVIKKGDKDWYNVARVKEIIKRKEVDFIINLHDGHGFYRDKWENSIFNPRAWGQTYVIDQKTLSDVKFGNLDEITKSLEQNLNTKLHKDFHHFNIRNTETKFKDEEQQNSLTFFAITHLKPAIAIETSKNIQELHLKTLYQLYSIEALMEVLGLQFERNFDLDIASVSKAVDEYGTLKLNDNFTIPLSNVRSTLRFIPLKKTNNKVDFTHPLGRLVEAKKGYEVYIGHKKVTQLLPDFFTMNCDLKGAIIVADNNEEKFLNFGEAINFKQNFLIKSQNNVRVNVIGYSKKGVVSEDNLLIHKNSLDKSFSLDKQQTLYRAEFYKGNEFCGLVRLQLQ